MTEQTSAAPPTLPEVPATGQQAPPPAAPEPDADRASTVSTVLMTVAVVAAAVVLLDIATKGRVLGPLFAMFGAGQAAPPPGDEPPAAPGA